MGKGHAPVNYTFKAVRGGEEMLWMLRSVSTWQMVVCCCLGFEICLCGFLLKRGLLVHGRALSPHLTCMHCLAHPIIPSEKGAKGILGFCVWWWGWRESTILDSARGEKEKRGGVISLFFLFFFPPLPPPLILDTSYHIRLVKIL